MRRDRMRIGMHVEHHPTGRYLGMVADLGRTRAVVRISHPYRPDVWATPHEIRPALNIPEGAVMPITKDRPVGGYRRPIEPGDAITTAWLRPLGVVTAVDGDTVHYTTPDGQQATFNRRQVRRVNETLAAKTPAAPAPANPKTAPARKLPDRKAAPAAPKRATKAKELRDGAYVYGQAALSATQEALPGHPNRIGTVIRVFAAGREIVVRVTPAGKNAAVTVDGQTIGAAK